MRSSWIDTRTAHDVCLAERGSRISMSGNVGGWALSQRGREGRREDEE